MGPQDEGVIYTEQWHSHNTALRARIYILDKVSLGIQ